jgi:hypothetical protein|nr:MAG TPA: hypothetical protein [Caudoviricetes sp.]
MKYIVFDIDGVLADCSHRLKYIQGEDKDYDSFYSYDEILKDKPILNLDKILLNIQCAESSDIDIRFITARNIKSITATAEWLEKYFSIMVEEGDILMRPEKDWRPAYQVKEDLIEKHIGFENILFAFDDDDKVNEMYKKHGVTCYKPNITNVV